MSTKDFEFFHGAAIARLVGLRDDGILVCRRDDLGFGCYEICDDIGILVKYSTKRMTPWTFTFQANHRNTIEELRSNYNAIMLLLMCNEDGIVALDYQEAITLLSPEVCQTWTISVERKPRSMYSVGGTGGKLRGKFGDLELAKSLLQARATRKRGATSRGMAP